ncbi:HTH domain-containing protein [Vulcanisaeta thermophila]|uniref:HTH domain-containing protein n=1 Tax=Vulcanisaeta thermophila TaxID=867917 RepID=UPI000853169C|nr:HTH domain-containing protein [Vulcanisaeta thermophila]
MELTLKEEILILLREKGPLTADEIAHYLGVDVESVAKELNYLENDKIVTRTKRGFLIKRDAYELTPTGLEEANKALEKLKVLANRITTAAPDEAVQLLNEYAQLIPLMLLLNLIPMDLLLLAGFTEFMISQENVDVDMDDTYTVDDTAL